MHDLITIAILQSFVTADDHSDAIALTEELRDIDSEPYHEVSMLIARRVVHTKAVLLVFIDRIRPHDVVGNPVVAQVLIVNGPFYLIQIAQLPAAIANTAMHHETIISEQRSQR